MVNKGGFRTEMGTPFAAVSTDRYPDGNSSISGCILAASCDESGESMTKLGLLATAAAALVAMPANAAVTLSFGGTADASATFNFDGATPEYSGTIFNDSVANVRARPTASTGGYAALAGGAENTATLDLSSFGQIGSISFLWGTPDGYNTLAVDGTTFSFTGAGLAEGVYTLTFTGADRAAVTGLTFSSSQAAFELDNVSVAAVPEPASWAMMIGGFGLVGGAARSRSRKAAVAA